MMDVRMALGKTSYVYSARSKDRYVVFLIEHFAGCYLYGCFTLSAELVRGLQVPNK